MNRYLVLLMVPLLAACSLITTTPTRPPLPLEETTLPGKESLITIRGVTVQPKSFIRFSGRSDLPDASCLHTQLYENDEPVEWWPHETCATVKDGLWQIQVPLGFGGAPEELDGSAFFVLRAWQADTPAVEAQHFPFDLQGPPE